MNGGGLDLHGSGSVAHQDLSILDGAMEIHAALRELSQGSASVLRDVDDGQIRATREGSAGLFPPPIGSSATVGIDDDSGCATTGLSYDLFIGLTHLNPEINCTGEIFLPQRRLVFRADAAAEQEGVVCVSCEGQQSHHHALIGLRRMTSQRDGMILIVVPIYVGDMQGGFEDGGIGGHGVFELSCKRVLADRQSLRF